MLTIRLRILLDASAARSGNEVTFTEISDFLSDRGIAISRARWSYMVNGHRLVDDAALLDALSDFFDVPHGYLRGESETPAKLAAELDLIRAMRAAKVKTFATRTLGDLSPEILEAITAFLDEDVRKAGEFGESGTTDAT